jgi:hypothetical protein
MFDVVKIKKDFGGLLIILDVVKIIKNFGHFLKVLGIMIFLSGFAFMGLEIRWAGSSEDLDFYFILMSYRAMLVAPVVYFFGFVVEQIAPKIEEL